MNLRREDKITGALMLGLALLIAPVRPRAAPDGGLPGSFTRQGAGARALGLAGSFAGIADDASAVYWNPAGLAQLTKPELMFNHTTLFSGTSNDFIGYGMPLKRFGAVGGGYLRQTSGGFQKRETPFDAPVSFSIANSLLQLGWAAGIPEKYTAGIVPGQFSFGLVFKSVSQQIDTAGGSGTGADAGLLYRGKDGLSIGFVVQNILPPSVTLVSKAVTFPRVLDVAPAYTRAIGRDIKTALAARTNYFAGRFHPGGGLELWYLGKYALRAGAEAKGVSLGAGARLNNYQLDYTVLMHEIALSHTISFSVKFGMTGPELAEEIKRGMTRLDREEAKRVAHSYYLEALILEKDGNFTAAIGNLEKSDLLDPDNKQVVDKLQELKAGFARQLSRQLAETSVILARQQYQQGNILVSLEYWKSVLQVDPANAEAKLAIETIQSRLGSQEAEMLAKVQKDIADVQIFQFLAKARGFKDQGLFAEAAAEAEKALKVDSADEQAKNLLQEINRARREKADQLLKQAAQAEEGKDFKSAAAAYQEILQLSPGYPGVSEKLRAAQAALSGRVKPALKKEAERLYYVAVDQYIKKQYAESARTLSRIFELDPANAGALKLKAKVEATLK